MQVLWDGGALVDPRNSGGLPRERPPAYTTIQTTVYRLETKNAVRRVKKISNAHIFEATVSRQSAHRRLVDDLLGLFGGARPTRDGAPDRSGQAHDG